MGKLNECVNKSYEKYNSSLRRNEGSANLLETKEKDLLNQIKSDKQNLTNVSSFSIQNEKFDLKKKELQIKTHEKPQLFIDKKTFGYY